MSKPKRKFEFLNRNFVLLWQGNAASTIGDVLYSIAIGIWVFNKTGSTALMGLMTSFTYLVSFVIGPFSGVLADRLNRRNILVVADAVRGGLILLIAYFAFQNSLQVWQILLVAFAAAVCNVFFSPAANSMLVQLVKSTDLMQAQSLFGGTTSLVNLIGNAISGFFVITFGVPLMILINGISFLVSAVTEWFIKAPKQSGEGTKLTGKMVIEDFKDGLHYLKSQPGLLNMLVAAFFINLCGAGFGAVVYPWALAKGMSVTEYGMFLGIESGASVLAMLILSAIHIKPKNRFRVMSVSIVLSTIFGIITMLMHGFILCSVFDSLSMFTNVIFNMITSSALMLMLDERYRGKSLGILSAIAQGGVAISMLLYGAFSSIVNVQIVALVGIILMIIPGVIYLRNRSLHSILEAEEPDLDVADSHPEVSAEISAESDAPQANT